jgi:hypothetical protein
MTDYTQAGKEVAARLFTDERRGNIGVERLCNELGEILARLEALENYHPHKDFNNHK